MVVWVGEIAVLSGIVMLPFLLLILAAALSPWPD